MPIVLKKQIGEALLIVWRITESEQELRQLATFNDITSAERFANPNRRIEHLAWRVALREIIPTAEINYNTLGAPTISDENYHIGVSHTDNVVVVVISKSPCAVDVESVIRDFSAAKRRYLSTSEMALPDASHQYFDAAIWCSKEALYKYSGCRELSFIDDIQISSSDLENGKLTAALFGTQRVGVEIIVWEGEYVVAIIA